MTRGLWKIGRLGHQPARPGALGGAGRGALILPGGAGRPSAPANPAREGLSRGPLARASSIFFPIFSPIFFSSSVSPTRHARASREGLSRGHSRANASRESTSCNPGPGKRGIPSSATAFPFLPFWCVRSGPWAAEKGPAPQRRPLGWVHVICGLGL